MEGGGGMRGDVELGRLASPEKDSEEDEDQDKDEGKAADNEEEEEVKNEEKVSLLEGRISPSPSSPRASLKPVSGELVSQSVRRRH